MPDEVEDCIACKIYTFDVQQADVGYQALSYVWGDPKQTRRVYLADAGNEQWTPYPLHENLSQFLDQIWQNRMFDRLFWTDYLCLDQSNASEIAQQIPRMGSIYSVAEQVISWIQLPQRTRKLLRMLLLSTPKSWWFQDDYCKWLDAVQMLAQNIYWRRVWIMQEVVLAKRVCIMSGKEISFDLDKLVSILQTEMFRDRLENSRFPFGSPRRAV